jgi:hypothetical protein
MGGGGRRQLTASIGDPIVVKRILDHLALGSTRPPLAPLRIPDVGA